MALKLGYHGGLCCGIKILRGFYEHPDQMQEALEALPYHGASPEGGRDFITSINFFDKAAPEETGRDRLKRLLDFCDTMRPGGLVEAVLAKSNGYSGYQIEQWEPVLLENGFKMVTEFTNINSDNMCRVYHRVTEYTGDPYEGDEYYEDSLPCGCCPCCGCECDL